MAANRSAAYLIQRVRERIGQFNQTPYRDGFSTDTVANPTRCISILHTLRTVLGWVYETGVYQPTFTFSTVIGQNAYSIDSSIILIHSVRVAGYPLEHAAGGERQIEEDYPAYLGPNSPTGDPLIWANRGATQIILYPAPESVMTVTIQAAAYPTNELGGASDSTTTDTPLGLSVYQQDQLPIMAAYLLAISDPESEGMRLRAEAYREEARLAASVLGIQARYNSLPSYRDSLTVSTPSQEGSDGSIKDIR